jgi:hypothetical protein
VLNRERYEVRDTKVPATCNEKEKLMSKRLILGLLTLGAIAFLGTEAHAGCCCDPLLCASWINGSGMPTGLVTAAAGPGGFAPSETSCPGVLEFQGSGEIGIDSGVLISQDGRAVISQVEPPVPPVVTSVTLRLVGTEGVACGLFGNQACDIRGVAVCENSVHRNVETPGPLEVFAPGFAQSDSSQFGGTNNANFRFQLDPFQQAELCPDDTFVAFFAREGFFEACVNSTIGTSCVREFCRVDVGGIQRDVPRTYNCKPI